MLLSIRDYAKSRFISYEAARRSVIRYKKDLKGKIEVKQHTQYLTDAAIEFLDEHRKYSPIIVHKDNERQEKEIQKNELEDLRAKYTAALEKIAALQAEHARDKKADSEKIEMLYQKQVLLLEANNRKWWQFGKK